jgi:hypothetical protein
MERVIEMNAVQSPLALDLARETRTAVTPTEFMNDTMRRERGLAEIQAFLNRQRTQAAEQAAKSATQSTAEKMLIMAIQSNAAPLVIETMQKGMEITDTRLAELKILAQAK